jgi:hypothetical protein
MEIRGVDFSGQGLRNLRVKVLGQQAEVALSLQNLDSRDDGHLNADISALVDKVEEVLVVEEHLRDDVVRPGFHLLL